MSTRSVRRILVMGCSRSGTTLLQSLLASHSQIHTFPETGVFLKAFGMRGRVLPWVHLGLTAGKERGSLAKLLLSQNEASGPLPSLPPWRVLLSRSLADAVAFLDDLALAHQREVWVEKTPRHVLHARRIGRNVPEALCVHMVRRGQDVVASIVDRARKYPERFSRQADPSYGIRQWNQSIRATRNALGDPGHAIVLYDRLVTDLEGTLRALCAGAGLDFEDSMLNPADPSSFTTAEEEWKPQVKAHVAPAKSKFEELFDEKTRREIESRLHLDAFKRLEVAASGSPGGVPFSAEP